MRGAARVRARSHAGRRGGRGASWQMREAMAHLRMKRKCGKGVMLKMKVVLVDTFRLEGEPPNVEPADPDEFFPGTKLQDCEQDEGCREEVGLAREPAHHLHSERVQCPQHRPDVCAQLPALGLSVDACASSMACSLLASSSGSAGAQPAFLLILQSPSCFFSARTARRTS